MSKPIYLDYHASTPVDPAVLEAMLPFFIEIFGNASAKNHSHGFQADRALEAARKQIAESINAKPRDIFFTSGATESNNWALLGTYHQAKKSGINPHFITCNIEHRSVLNTCKELKNRGAELTILEVDKMGLVSVEQIEKAIQPNTVMVSIMAANNEIGTVQPIEEIGAICRKHNILFFTDAVQGFGRLNLDVEQMNIDLMSISGHKIYAPKGIGILYIRQAPHRVKLEPLMYGGSHERGQRPGTVNVPGAVALGKACELSISHLIKENERLSKMRQEFLSDLKQKLSMSCSQVQLALNGHPQKRLCHNLSLTFSAPQFQTSVFLHNVLGSISISMGSACATSSIDPSHVLKAIGLTDEEAFATIRLGLGRFTTAEDMKKASDSIMLSCQKALGMNPQDLINSARRNLDEPANLR